MRSLQRGTSMEVGDTTLIPLISVGFGFGAFGGTGNDPKKGAGTGTGIGAGGGVKPVALVILGPEGVRLESVKSGAASVVDKAIDTLVVRSTTGFGVTMSVRPR